MEISADSLGYIKPALGLTQYNLGAVVLTLKAKGVLELLESWRYSVVCWVKEPRNVSKKKRKEMHLY